MRRRKTSLREYQMAVAERLRDLSLQAASASSKLGFFVGDSRWVLNLNEVAEVLPVPAIVSIPLTRDYFAGMCNVRGNLYGIVNLAAFLGQNVPATAVENRLLLLPAPLIQGAALLVSRMAGLRNPDSFTALPRPSGTPRWVAHLYRDTDGNTWQELDVVALTQQEQFLNVGR